VVDAIIEALKQEIRSRNLELLDRHAKDLVVHDRAMFDKFVAPCARFAWMVGHSHTHSAPLGVHSKLNELPTFVTNLANEDVFFTITVGRSAEKFSIEEVSRKQFPELAKTPIPFKRIGLAGAFWLYKGAARIGSCTIQAEGPYQARIHNVRLSAMAGVSPFERAVLEEWARQAVVEMAGTLFARSNVLWENDIELPLAA
jgi:hypothetical protein